MDSILIKTIPFDSMRYPSCGDYWIDPDGTIQVRIAEMEDSRHVSCILLHEITELLLVLQRKIPIESIDKFDMDFEDNRAPGNFDEPGDDPDSPYENCHNLATGIERIFASVCGVKWKPYEQAVNAL